MEFAKMLELGKRVYNNKMTTTTDEAGKTILSDEEAIKALCSKVFDGNGGYRNFEDFRSFNKLIVEVADFEAQANVQQILDAISDYSKVGRYDTKVYDVNKQSKISMALSASASGVDFVRIPANKTQVTAVPQTHQFGVQYSIDRMITDPVNEFRNAVNYVQEYKVKYIFKKVMETVRAASLSGKIPATQVHDASNMTLAQYRTIEGKLLRYGKNVKPILIADINFIAALAEKQGNTSNIWLTEELRASLLHDVNIEQISRSIAIATDNPFTDEANSKVDLDPAEALLLAGGTKSPFRITEFGELRQASDMPSIEKETVFMKIDMRLDVTLLVGSAMAYLHDDSVIL